MRINVSIEWKNCPGSGSIEVLNGEFVAGTIMLGTGRLDGNHFTFTGSGPCKIPFAVEGSRENTSVSIGGVDEPFTFALKDASADRAAPLPGSDILVAAEEDWWSSL